VLGSNNAIGDVKQTLTFKAQVDDEIACLDCRHKLERNIRPRHLLFGKRYEAHILSLKSRQGQAGAAISAAINAGIASSVSFAWQALRPLLRSFVSCEGACR